jgi:hypothetical protein
VVLFADICGRWSRDESLETMSGLLRPPTEVAVALYSTGLGCVIRANRRYPLFVLKSTTYHVPAVLGAFADRLIELQSQGAAVDVATLQLARTVART